MKAKVEILLMAIGLLFFTIKGIAQVVEKSNIQYQIENSLMDLTGQSKAPVNLISEMTKYNVPGFGFVVLDENRVVAENYYGVTKKDSGQQVNNQTLFEAASVTKMLTAILVMHFAETGTLKIEDDVNKYLKGWKLPESQYTKENPVIVDQVLTHRAGFNRPEGGFSFVPEKTGSLIDLLKGEYPAKSNPLTIETKPGEWNYSNFGYVLLQFLLEEVSGKPFAELTKEIIFNPLKMKNSSMGLPLTKKQWAAKAYSHSVNNEIAQHGLQEVASAHGGLVTTPSDMALLVNELMLSYTGKSSKLISKESAQKLLASRIALNPAVMGGIEVSQGYGVLVRGTSENIAFMMAGQNNPGATCIVMGFPNTGQGAVVMTNGEMGELVQLELIAGLGKVFNWPSSRLF